MSGHCHRLRKFYVGKVGLDKVNVGTYLTRTVLYLVVNNGDVIFNTVKICKHCFFVRLFAENSFYRFVVGKNSRRRLCSCFAIRRLLRRAVLIFYIFEVLENGFENIVGYFYFRDVFPVFVRNSLAVFLRDVYGARVARIFVVKQQVGLDVCKKRVGNVFVRKFSFRFSGIFLGDEFSEHAGGLAECVGIRTVRFFYIQTVEVIFRFFVYFFGSLNGIFQKTVEVGYNFAFLGRFGKRGVVRLFHALADG